MKRKNGAQHRAKNRFHFRTFHVNGAYLAVLEVNGIKGGYSSWGETRVDSITNVMNLAGQYIKSLDL